MGSSFKNDSKMKKKWGCAKKISTHVGFDRTARIVCIGLCVLPSNCI